MYRKSVPFYLILNEMKLNTFGKLDPSIMTLFIEKILNNLVGREVLLSNGIVGKVVLVNQNDPSKPLVQTSNGFIDLGKETEITLMKIF